MHTTQYIATTYNIANYIQHNRNNNYTTTQYTIQVQTTYVKACNIRKGIQHAYNTIQLHSNNI